MKLAFYKGKGTLFDRAVQWWTSSPYSHCEIVLDVDTGKVENLCASSSFRDKGVRIKLIDLTTGRWDLVDIPWADEEAVTDWFLLHSGEGYDTIGLLGFVIPFRDISDKWFCSEACVEALGFSSSETIDPGMLNVIASRFRSLSKD